MATFPTPSGGTKEWWASLSARSCTTERRAYFITQSSGDLGRLPSFEEAERSFFGRLPPRSPLAQVAELGLSFGSDSDASGIALLAIALLAAASPPPPSCDAAGGGGGGVTGEARPSTLGVSSSPLPPPPPPAPPPPPPVAPPRAGLGRRDERAASSRLRGEKSEHDAREAHVHVWRR